MGKDYECWAPRGQAPFSDGAAPDDPGPWLSQSSPIDLAFEYGGSPSTDAGSIDGPTVDAVVKWFRADKGYGFVELSGGQGDAFLNLRALRSAGLDSMPAGARLGDGPKGPLVSRIVKVGAFSIVYPPGHRFEET